MERNYVFIFVNANSMYEQYKVNVSENQVDTLKDAIRLKKGATLGFPKGGIMSPVQVNRLDKAQADGKRVQIRMSARQVAKNVSYTGGFIATLVSFLARALPTIMSGLATGLLFAGVHKAISGNGVTVGDGLDTSMINAPEYRN